MDAQNEIAVGNIIKQMIASGMTRSQAVAVGMAMEHALTSAEYAAVYGKFLQEELALFVQEAGKQQ